MELIYPNEKYLKSYEEAFNEQKRLCPNEGGMCPPSLILETAYKFRNGINIPKGLLPRTILWLIDNDEFIGFVDIRHGLDDILMNRGGHIGYLIKYTKRRQGYGYKQFELALEYIKKTFNFDKLLVTCDDDNIPSIKIIERYGGKLSDKIENILDDGKKIITRRYWINLL